MITLVYSKKCDPSQLAAEVFLGTGNPVDVTGSMYETRVTSYIALDQTAKDTITAIVAAHVPDWTGTKETIALP
jgi:hypothetical protein